MAFLDVLASLAFKLLVSELLFSDFQSVNLNPNVVWKNQVTCQRQKVNLLLK